MEFILIFFPYLLSEQGTQIIQEKIWNLLLIIIHMHYAFTVSFVRPTDQSINQRNLNVLVFGMFFGIFGFFLISTSVS